MQVKQVALTHTRTSAQIKACQSPSETDEVVQMLGKGIGILSIKEIRNLYSNEWVALAIAETDADGFASSGEVIMHDRDERFVWTAIKLREIEEPIYVFHTGSQRILNNVA